MRYFRESLLGIVIVLLFSGTAATSGVTLETGGIEGAKFAIAVPKIWEGKLLLIAHGLRHEDAPLLADVNVKDEAYAALLRQNWIVAITSYRRNGWIIEDAMLDLDNLLRHITETRGKPKCVIVQGSSMGGRIAVRLAEREKQHAVHYDGFVAIGAALGVTKEPDKTRKIVFTPHRCILFLSNQNEIGDPTVYALRSPQGEGTPAIWVIVRDGHCNVLPKERLAAIEAMGKWLETGEVDRFRNATMQPDKVESVAEFRDGWAYAEILGISPVYGNFNTAFLKEDVEKLGIEKGERFLFRFGNKTFEPLYGTTYGDVERGDWIAFLLANGRLRIARNFADASKTAGCGEGDTVCIARKKD
jgi:pimeloyl-ACP methyl ester carboxylesterase